MELSKTNLTSHIMFMSPLRKLKQMSQRQDSDSNKHGGDWFEWQRCGGATSLKLQVNKNE